MQLSSAAPVTPMPSSGRPIELPNVPPFYTMPPSRQAAANVSSYAIQGFVAAAQSAWAATTLGELQSRGTLVHLLEASSALEVSSHMMYKVMPESQAIIQPLFSHGRRMHDMIANAIYLARTEPGRAVSSDLVPKLATAGAQAAEAVRLLATT